MMSQAAVLQDEKQRRKKGTAGEPVRAVDIRKAAAPLVRKARRSNSAARLFSRGILGPLAHHLANAAWHSFQTVNRVIPQKSMQPKWAPAPLLKSYERS